MVAKYLVKFTQSAKKDLTGIARWVMQNDSPGKAASLLTKLEEACSTLNNLPSRGHALPELASIDYQGYLEIHQGPYRIIYHLQEQFVLIDAVLDGRRDIHELLAKRLLG